VGAISVDDLQVLRFERLDIRGIDRIVACCLIHEIGEAVFVIAYISQIRLVGSICVVDHDLRDVRTYGIEI
jgi:hypothetical protein